MPDHANVPDPSSPERNPRGLGPNDRDGSNTGSSADTSYNALGSDPYTTGEPQKDFDAQPPTESTPADPDTPSSEEP